KIQWQCHLEQDDCDAIVQFLKKEPSDLHIQGMVKFRPPGKVGLQTQRFLFPLRQALDADFWEHEPWQRIRYKYFDTQGNGYQDLPKVQRLLPSVSKARGQQRTDHLVSVNQDYVSTISAAKPTAVIAADQLIQSPLAIYDLSSQLWTLETVMANWNATKKRSLPVVTKEKSFLWSDRLSSKKFWYYPEAILKQPRLDTEVAHSPFLFRFKTIGYDRLGLPILEGEIKVSIEQGPSPNTQAAIQEKGAKSTVLPVDFTSERFALQIPFTDQEGEAKRSTIPASKVVRKGESVELHFRLTNDWIRAAYGAFSVEGFQSQKAVLQISTSFQGYQILRSNEYSIASGNKLSGIPTIYENVRNAPEGKIWLNGTTKSIHFSGGTINLQDGVTLQPTANSLTSALNPGFKPTIKPTSKEVLKTFGRTQKLELFFDCASFGALYQRANSSGSWESIGCETPYLLGQIEFRLYDEIVELETQYYRVFRSTQSPSRFMVLPKNYRITRFSTDLPDRAYRPCVYLYAAIDIDQLNDSRFILDATLEPDIPRFARRELQAQLKAYTPYEPEVEYITQTDSEATFSWLIPTQGETTVNTVVIGQAIHLSMEANILDLLNFQNRLANGAIHCMVEFTAPVGSRYYASLYPDLSNIIGPWREGPIQQRMVGGMLHLENVVNNTQHITAIQGYDSSWNPLELVPVEISLRRGESSEIELSGEAVYWVPIYKSDPVLHDLEESKSFIEDVECQVSFLVTADFAEQNIEVVKVEARLKGQDHIYPLLLDKDQSVGELVMLMPLTRYVFDRILEFRIKTIFKDDTPAVTHHWQEWSLQEAGTIINLTTNMIINP
ncbi:MAG: hypothetical protein AAGH79_18505, partial [Bacteroidota bacterium]